MTKFYVTADCEQSEFIDQNATILEFDNLPQAENYLKSCFGELDKEETIEIAEGRYGDCWIKITSYPEDFVFEPLVAEQVNILRPGQHPGGSFFWITPAVTVLVPVINRK